MNKEETIKSAIEVYKENMFKIELFLKGIVNYFSDHPGLNEGALPVIHSVKSRLKDPKHLEDKIKRKWDKIGPINSDNILNKITDLAGIRVLHLYQAQFPEIHDEIMKQIDEKEWFFDEPPKAYTWDPESKSFFQKYDIECQIKESFYTSVHYVVKPREDSPFRCEIQVRTLFEEIWGEIDHVINYPQQTESIACREQLKVLAKLASAGTRLADSIFSSFQEYHKTKV